MSAAAARRRKQLEKKKAAAAGSSGGNGAAIDPVDLKLQSLMEECGTADTAIAYEALQLAQSQVRKLINAQSYEKGTELAYSTALTMLQNDKPSVASQLLHLLNQILRETQTNATDKWLTKLVTLHEAHQKALISIEKGSNNMIEWTRLMRLEGEFLRKCIAWSNDFGTIRFGSVKLHKELGMLLWELASKEEEEDVKNQTRTEAIHALVLAEEPMEIIKCLESLPAPTDKELSRSRKGPPAIRDSLLTLSILAFCGLENLRDANVLMRAYMEKMETRPIDDMTKSYMSKDDGLSPPHTIFGCMMLRLCEKDTRTGPLFQWLLRSFKKEFDSLNAVVNNNEPSKLAQLTQSYCTKIGKVYFNIQPPPSMMAMMENMMGMMGGGGGMGGMNPAMMQAAMAQGGMR